MLHENQPNPRRSLLATLPIGIGVMAAVDEIIFHQILGWHHFYDQATPAIALLSDGLLHAAELIILVAGFFLFAELRHRRALAPVAAWAGFFLGAGAFQLFDGIVDHKLLQLHQIRYGIDNLWLYDLLWNLSALVLLVIGVVLARRAFATAAPASTATPPEPRQGLP